MRWYSQLRTANRREIQLGKNCDDFDLRELRERELRERSGDDESESAE
jgi:hypothetical protein